MIPSSSTRPPEPLLTSQKGSIIASINLLLAGILVLAAAGWPFIQKGWHGWIQREAKGFFEQIEQAEYRYKNVNNRYLTFSMQGSDKGLKELRLDPEEAENFIYSVESLGRQGFRIIAHAGPEVLEKWYLHGPRAKFRLIYEKKANEKGRFLP
jgi:hypothetical protein